jgi:ATP-dependent DNA helicase RecG
MKRGEKVFVIAPLVEESEHMEDVANVLETYEYMKDEFPEFRDRIGLMHGKLKPKEKDEVMRQFAHGDIMMLVSTTVIEVGVDVRQATMMMIMNAERFGLSQLHQLRGRIGRNDMQSYCFLDCKKKSSDARVRLSAMEQYTD